MSKCKPSSKEQAHPKMLLLAMVVGVCMLLVCVPFLGPPTFGHLKEGCVATLKKEPNAATLEAWLTKNKIPFSKREAPYDGMFEEILEQHGMARSQVKQSRLCLFFENVPVRWGFPASHLAHGYFLFSADGSVIDYQIFDAYQFL